MRKTFATIILTICVFGSMGATLTIPTERSTWQVIAAIYLSALMIVLAMKD